MRPFLRRWRLGLPVGLFLAALLGAAVVCLSAGGERVCRATCDKIQMGMTRAEVEALVGREPDFPSVGSPLSFWVSDDADVLTIDFGIDGRVCSKDFTELDPWEKATLRIRRLLHRLFRWSMDPARPPTKAAY